jgi:adenine C2-methylase RlmN of 23S rRNA A2503 and tRNA A37
VASMKSFNEYLETEERINTRFALMRGIDKGLQMCEDIIDTITDYDAEVNLLTNDEFNLLLTLSQAICKVRNQII